MSERNCPIDNVCDILEEYLKKHGRTGLYNAEHGCSCFLAGGIRCKHISWYCSTLTEPKEEFTRLSELGYLYPYAMQKLPLEYDTYKRIEDINERLKYPIPSKDVDKAGKEAIINSCKYIMFEFEGRGIETRRALFTLPYSIFMAEYNPSRDLLWAFDVSVFYETGTYSITTYRKIAEFDISSPSGGFKEIIKDIKNSGILNKPEHNHVINSGINFVTHGTGFTKDKDRIWYFEKHCETHNLNNLLPYMLNAFYRGLCSYALEE
jgi:hypothetical protein